MQLQGGFHLGRGKLHKHKCIEFILSTSVGLDKTLFSIIKWSHSPCASSLGPFSI